MARSRTTMFVPALLAALIVTACGGGSGAELRLIRTFFDRSNVGDRGSLQGITLFMWDAGEMGTVSRPAIDSMSEERRRPLRIKALTQAVVDANTAERAFAQEKIAYQDENFDAIVRVLEAERNDEEVASRDANVQEAWTDWRTRTMEHTKRISDAGLELSTEENTASLSVYDPSNPIDLAEFDGEVVTKDVMITANIEIDGIETERQLTVTLLRTVLTGGEEPIEGRWVIANVS